jgi:hypothetical protein
VIGYQRGALEINVTTGKTSRVEAEPTQARPILTDYQPQLFVAIGATVQRAVRNCDLVNDNRGLRDLKTRLAELLEQKSDKPSTKIVLLRRLENEFEWLPEGTTVAVNSDGQWIAGERSVEVIKTAMKLHGVKSFGRVFTIGQRTHVGGGSWRK